MRQQAKGAKPIEHREEMEPTRKLFLQQKPTLLISCLKPSSGFPFQPEQDPDSSVSTVILSSLIFLHATLLRGFFRPFAPKNPLPVRGGGIRLLPPALPRLPQSASVPQFKHQLSQEASWNFTWTALSPYQTSQGPTFALIFTCLSMSLFKRKVPERQGLCPVHHWVSPPRAVLDMAWVPSIVPHRWAGSLNPRPCSPWEPQIANSALYWAANKNCKKP